MKSLSDPQCKEEILVRLGRVQFDAHRRWGKMNAGQMICHLNDCFLGVMGDKPMEIMARYPMRKLVKWIALDLPFQWPHGVSTRPEFDSEIGGTPPADFELYKQELLLQIEKFIKAPRTFKFRPHPMFLEMTDQEWMRWGYRHMDHHLRQFGE